MPLRQPQLNDLKVIADKSVGLAGRFIQKSTRSADDIEILDKPNLYFRVTDADTPKSGLFFKIDFFPEIEDEKFTMFDLKKMIHKWEMVPVYFEAWLKEVRLELNAPNFWNERPRIQFDVGIMSQSRFNETETMALSVPIRVLEEKISLLSDDMVEVKETFKKGIEDLKTEMKQGTKLTWLTCYMGLAGTVLVAFPQMQPILRQVWETATSILPAIGPAVNIARLPSARP